MMKADYWGEIQETHHVYDNLPEKEVSGYLAFGGGMQSSVILELTMQNHMHLYINLFQLMINFKCLQFLPYR